MEIKKIDINNITDAINFLGKVSEIKSIDDSILINGCMVKENDEVIGTIAYEKYDNLGIIRYFVFKKIKDNLILVKLIDELCSRLKENNLNKLVCIADSNTLKELFEEMGFVKIDKKIYINETNVEKTSFKDSIFLLKCINNI